MGLRPAGAAGVRLRPFTPAAPAAAALPGRRGGGAEAPRRLLLFDWARPGAVSLGSGSVSLSSLLSAPHSRRLTAAAAAGGAWRFEGERRRGEGRGGGGGAAVAGGGAVCPGTERPRPWRTPISSSTSSSATQVRVPGSASGCRWPAGLGRGANGVGPRRGRRRRPAPPSQPRRSISAVLELVTWALRMAAAWPGPTRSPCPEQPAAGGRGGRLRRPVWEVYDSRGLPAQGRQGQAQTIAFLRQGSIT